MNVLVPLGTRPEIVKGAPVVRALRERGVDVRTIATGQHSGRALADAFFADLGVEPDERWVLPETEAERVGEILTRAMLEVATAPPDLVLVVGDTYTVPLFCLAARRHGVPVGHVEAGLRSYNERSLEELDRLVAMVGASVHFAPTQLAADNLTGAGVPADRVHVVGNPGIDTLRTWGLHPTPVADRAGVVVTAHRATNVDDPERLRALVDLVVGLTDLGRVTFPVQPRTMARLETSGLLDRLEHPQVSLLPPITHRDMLELVRAARVVVTDSGGLQEEAAWFGVPVVVLRHSTPRWEGVLAGTSELVGIDADRALEAAARLGAPDEQARIAAVPCPYGDGYAAERIADIVCDESARPPLTLVERDFVGKPVAP
jgi:UDP-N-acetylglucosamine 2-epimerase (non-hydrolysing)